MVFINKIVVIADSSNFHHIDMFPRSSWKPLEESDSDNSDPVFARGVPKYTPSAPQNGGSGKRRLPSKSMEVRIS